MPDSFQTTIKCPLCGHRERVDVPTDRCVLRHECNGCGATLTRQPGSCCVYCAHPAEQPAAPAG
ncbi:MAG: GDCCVxC domain-containing (seleno)protein [Pseudomonadota bacterium]